MKHLLFAAALLVLGFSILSCGQDSKKSQTKPAKQPKVEQKTTPPVEKPVETAPATPKVENGKIVISGNDQMRYDLESFEVAAGTELTVVLKHVGSLPINVMGHNIVFLKLGVDVNAFGAGVAQNGGNADNGYLPTDQSQILAHSKMVGGGEEDTITFTVPAEAGEYPFLCTFPGHFGLMKGTMIVK